MGKVLRTPAEHDKLRVPLSFPPKVSMLPPNLSGL